MWILICHMWINVDTNMSNLSPVAIEKTIECIRFPETRKCVTARYSTPAMTSSSYADDSNQCIDMSTDPRIWIERKQPVPVYKRRGHLTQTLNLQNYILFTIRHHCLLKRYLHLGKYSDTSNPALVNQSQRNKITLNRKSDHLILKHFPTYALVALL